MPDLFGRQAGQELRKIHQCLPEQEIDWYTKRWKKYQRKKQNVEENGLTLPRQEYVESYIERNFELLQKSKVTFQHDDFIPRNIIIDKENETIAGIIDFNRYDWGDPWEEFFKIPKYTIEVSIPFARGQIDGYFEDEIPDDFWFKYNLFTALNFHATIYSGYLLGDLEIYREKINRTLRTHDFENGGPPLWYTEENVI
jgi:aminoglycoside phosphotransferase (APT) family kinase protein